MKYEYMKEYETNGEKPDLPDDVLIKYKLRDGYESTSRIESIDFSVGGKLPNTNEVISFRIVDERYKPKPNDWHERGELPPVGEVVEYTLCNSSIWYECEIVSHNRLVISSKYIANDCDNGNGLMVVGDLMPIQFRPLRTEKDKLVEKAKEICKSWDDSCGKSIPELLVDAGYRKIKQQTEDEFITQARKELTDHVSINQIATLYRAGCRFVERGE